MSRKAFVRIELHEIRQYQIPVELEGFDNPASILEEAQRVLPSYLAGREGEVCAYATQLSQKWRNIPFGCARAPDDTTPVLKLRRRPDGGVEWVSVE